METRPTSLQRLLIVVVAACVVLALAPFIAATRAGAATNGSITLHVQSARSVNAGRGLRAQGRPGHQVQVADQRRRHRRPRHVGQPGDRARACPPRRRAAARIRTTPTPARGPRSATPPASRRSSRRATRPTSATARRSTTCPPGKYLISVTADGFKIDGQHFTVTPGGTHAGDGRDEPDPAAADHPAATGLQRQRAGRRARTRSTPSRGCAGFTAHLTDVFGTVSTDYYGNALCTDLPAPERKRHRPDAVRRQQPADHRHDPIHRQVRQRQRPG